jgi:hypothetical protein
MQRALTVLAALVTGACAIDSGTAPTANLITAAEKAAVQQALARSFGGDTLYAAFVVFVLPFMDQATPLVNPTGDTTRLAGFQLEAVAGSISAGVTGVLAWRGYRAGTGTVDTVVLTVGAGLEPPLTDSLSDRFAFNLLGSGTAWVVAQAADSSVQTWLARTGALTVTDARFGQPTTVDAGDGLTVSRARGSIAGDFHLTAKLIPDSSTTVGTTASFGGGIEAVRVIVTGELPRGGLRRTRPEPAPSPAATP